MELPRELRFSRSITMRHSTLGHSLEKLRQYINQNLRQFYIMEDHKPYIIINITTRGSLAKKKIMFLHSKNKASRKGYKGEC